MVTLTWCDVHLTEHDEERPAHPFTWDEYQLDLCEECLPTIAAARIMFEKYGSKGPRTLAPSAVVRKGKQPGGLLSCPAPDCGSVLGNRASLGAHARQIHGMTLGELEGRPVAHTCEECGQGFTTYQGITLHTRKHERERAAAEPKVRKRSGAKRAPAAQTVAAP
jgi:hypothetical protein